MSSSTALLPKERPKDDHPIFLRVCHSPWVNFGQKALCGLRGLIAAYLIAVFSMTIDYEINHVEHGYLAFFEFVNIAYFMLVLYHAIAFTWTFMHLHHPHVERHNPSILTSIQKFLSPPRQNSSTKNRTWFSIYYIAVNTFPWVAAAIYWAVLIPMNKSMTTSVPPLPHHPHFGFNTTLPIPEPLPADDMFSYGWFPPFIILNRYLVAPFITLLEVFFFSSIKRPTPVSAHISALTLLICFYIGWVYVGYVILDKYAFFFFDHEEIGWDRVIGAYSGFIVTELFFFSFIYVVIALREGATKKSERKTGGYQRLPQ